VFQGGYRLSYLIWYIDCSSDSPESISAFFFDMTDMPGSHLHEQDDWILPSLSRSLLPEVAGVSRPVNPRSESEAC